MNSFMAATQPHIHSFNHLITKNIMDGVIATPQQICTVQPFNLDPIELSIRMTSIEIGYPNISDDLHGSVNLTPRECRERQITYSAPMKVTFACRLDRGDPEILTKTIGHLPIMVLSNRSCPHA